MYVCLCKNITDHQIRREMDAGVCSLRELGTRLGLGTQCGKCCKCARTVMKEYRSGGAGYCGGVCDSAARVAAQAC